MDKSKVAGMTYSSKNDSPLTVDMLDTRRGYFIKAKDSIRKGLTERIILSKPVKFWGYLQLFLDVWHIVVNIIKYPEPTKENTKQPVTHAILDIFDEFFSFESNIYYHKKRQGRVPLYKAVRKILADECEHDGDIEERIRWFGVKVTEKVQSGEWPKLEAWMPTNFWKDPKTLEARRKKRLELIMEAMK